MVPVAMRSMACVNVQKASVALFARVSPSAIPTHATTEVLAVRSRRVACVDMDLVDTCARR